MTKRIASWCLGILFALIIGVLLATGIQSGIHFQFDQDELAHAQVSYLLTHGLVPYRHFFMTYTPVFHFIISPVFLLKGYSLDAMTLARFVMVGMFLLRVAASVWIAYHVFGKKVTAVFLLFFLIDPFTMYTAMQIRPDNLMMLLSTVGIALLLYAHGKRRLGYVFWSGILLTTSGIVLMKIVPTLAVICVALLWHGYKNREWQSVKVFLLGSIIPILLFFTYTTISGTTNEMVQEVVRDSYAINQSVAFPIPISHFYAPSKSALFDLYGAAYTRLPYFELALLTLAVIGLFLIRRTSSLFQWILGGSLIAQGITLSFVHSVFIQYFLPITWLVTLFAAYAVVKMVRGPVLLTLLIIILSFVSYDSVRANISRSYAVSNPTITWLTTVWKEVPDNASVYPNIPFRPLVYPLTFGYYFHDLPASVTNRLPPLVTTLERSQVQYILQTYEWRALPQNFFPYVYDRFHEVTPIVFIRN